MYKLPDGKFKVRTKLINKSMVCPTVEIAADMLEAAGVQGDEIDVALIEMTMKDHNYASFGIDEGKLLFSDVVDTTTVE